MRHRKAGKHLGRTPSHRKALWRNMAASLFQYGAIRTTEVKAKQLRRFAEKLITVAKKGDLHSRRRVIQLLQDREIYTLDAETGEHEPQGTTVVQKLFDEIAPRYAKRDGGYTRIIRVAERRIGDGGKQVILQLVEEEIAAGAKGGSSRRKARAEKRVEALKAAGVLAGKQETPAAVEEEAAAEEVAQAPVEEAPAQEATEETQETEAAAEEGEDKAE